MNKAYYLGTLWAQNLYPCIVPEIDEFLGPLSNGQVIHI